MTRFMIGTNDNILLATMNAEGNTFYILNGRWSGYLQDSGNWKCFPPSFPPTDITYVYDALIDVTEEEWIEYAKETGTDIYINRDALDRHKSNLENDEKEDVINENDFSEFNDDCPF